jgi:hypothetical protein
MEPDVFTVASDPLGDFGIPEQYVQRTIRPPLDLARKQFVRNGFLLSCHLINGQRLESVPTKGKRLLTRVLPVHR